MLPKALLVSALAVVAALAVVSPVALSGRSHGTPVKPLLVTANGSAPANTGADGPFAWRPDGKAVAFASDATNLVPLPRRGAVHVYVKPLAGGKLRLVDANRHGQAARNTRDPHFESGEPSWSADGSTIAFTSAASNLVSSPAGLGGGKFGQMTYLKQLSSGAVTLLATAREKAQGGDDDSLTWSPDGRWIAFDSIREARADAPRGGVFLARMPARTISTAWAVPERGSQGIWPVSWSPDSTRLAFCTQGKPGETVGAGIWVVDVAARRATRIYPFDNGQLCGSTGWSSDGRLLAWEADAGTVVRDFTTHKTVVLRGAYGFAWAPKGMSYAFTDDAQRRLEVARWGVSGSTRTLLLARRLGEFSFSPDATQLGFFGTVGSRTTNQGYVLSVS